MPRRPADGGRLRLPRRRRAFARGDGTADGGATWNTLATLNAPLKVEKAAVTEVRFADGFHGWVFGPALWSTTDGGTTWAKEASPGGGH